MSLGCHSRIVLGSFMRVVNYLRSLTVPSPNPCICWWHPTVFFFMAYPNLLANRCWMIKDKLCLNDNKTEFIIIGTRQQLAKVNVSSLCVGDAIIAPVTSVKNLGSWGPFLERPGNVSGPKANFKFKTFWKVAQFLAYKPLNFASWTVSFIVSFSKLYHSQNYWNFNL